MNLSKHGQKVVEVDICHPPGGRPNQYFMILALALILVSFWCHFGSNCPLKICEQIDAQIDGEQIMEINETSMRRWSRN